MNQSLSLSHFIRHHSDEIVSEWETFAKTCLPAAEAMDPRTLRNNAPEILEAIASDIESAQTAVEEKAKAEGRGPGGSLDKVGGYHAVERVAWGFSLEQLAAELRALRATVVRMWSSRGGDVKELDRFHEAIDQVLTASLKRYDVEFSRSRDMFLAILGHDLRAPLNSTMMAGSYLLRKKEVSREELVETAGGIVASGQRMKNLIQNLIEFAQLRMGESLNLRWATVNLRVVAEEIIREMIPLCGEEQLQLSYRGDLEGEWDGARLEQVLSNLVGNAIKHGAPGSPITITLEGEPDEVLLSVHNTGVPIPEAQLKQIFLPFKSGKIDGGEEVQGKSIGLGLYISEEIVAAHGGTISVDSSAGRGTRFVVRLPKKRAQGSGEEPVKGRN